ncbi:uncharacterized protein LOC105827875 [Monomorium pharaonis]|uniref:uncharacterized protein LOC105827875 n=1 Tax=Monomorium pharaonis TaxID=307658 RepID=UPI00063F0A16|nr:uncharacterized protein LOC105827875 [Monomorium pharaonis]
MDIKIRLFLITVIVLFVFDTEGIKILGRIGSGTRVSNGRSTFWQTSSNSRKTGWNQPSNSYYKGSISRTSHANPTSLSEFGFGTNTENMQSRYPSINNSPSHHLSDGYPQQPIKNSYRGTGLIYPPINPNPSYPNYEDHDHVI